MHLEPYGYLLAARHTTRSSRTPRQQALVRRLGSLELLLRVRLAPTRVAIRMPLERALVKPVTATVTTGAASGASGWWQRVRRLQGGYARRLERTLGQLSTA